MQKARNLFFQGRAEVPQQQHGANTVFIPLKARHGPPFFWQPKLFDFLQALQSRGMNELDEHWHCDFLCAIYAVGDEHTEAGTQRVLNDFESVINSSEWLFDLIFHFLQKLCEVITDCPRDCSFEQFVYPFGKVWPESFAFAFDEGVHAL